jgi:lysophospholipase L1-like esterase
MNNRNRFKTIIQNLSLLLISLVLSFLGLEFAARNYARITYKERIVTYDTLLGWKLTSNARKKYYDEESPYLIQTNSKGLRDKEYSYAKPASTYRIVVLGDSFVFGSGGVESQELFTEGMEARIPNTEVINMGVPAFSLDQEYLFFKSEGVKYHPDLVILCLFVNDFKETFLSFNPSNGMPKGYETFKAGELNFHPPSIPFLYRLSRYSYILGWIENKFRLLTFSKPPPEIIPHWTIDEKKRIFEQILVSLSSSCREHGAELWLVYFPYKKQLKKNVIQEVLGKLAKTANLKYIDFMDIFRELPSKDSLYFKKDVHFNSQGHAVVAETLCDALRRPVKTTLTKK